MEESSSMTMSYILIFWLWLNQIYDQHWNDLPKIKIKSLKNGFNSAISGYYVKYDYISRWTPGLGLSGVLVLFFSMDTKS